MLLKNCKLEKSLVMSIDNKLKQKVIGKSETTFRRYRNSEVVKIEPAPDILNDGTIHYVIFIKK